MAELLKSAMMLMLDIIICYRLTAFILRNPDTAAFPVKLFALAIFLCGIAYVKHIRNIMKSLRTLTKANIEMQPTLDQYRSLLKIMMPLRSLCTGRTKTQLIKLDDEIELLLNHGIDKTLIGGGFHGT